MVKVLKITATDTLENLRETEREELKAENIDTDVTIANLSTKARADKEPAPGEGKEACAQRKSAHSQDGKQAAK